MYKILLSLFLFFSCWFLLINCTDKKDEGEAIAKKYCSSCHLFPEPSLLNKITWQKSVLPAMGRLLGASYIEGNPFEESDRISVHQKAGIPEEDWKKIIRYYVSTAPKEMQAQQRKPIESFTGLFDVESKSVDKYPANTFIKIDPEKKWIYTATRDSAFGVFDHSLHTVRYSKAGDIITDMFFAPDSTGKANRTGVLTNIGFMDPNDSRTGSEENFTIDNKGKLTSKRIADSLPRPVQCIGSDLDLDGKMDYVVCGFGNKEGSFFWLRNKGDAHFEQKILRPLPGAIQVYIRDVNKDGLPDIIALFAQAQEGIFLFLNKGKGEFETKEIMRFPPVYGSTFFELEDFNGDGQEDILYTCGDNADYSRVLKNYHGVYIFVNEGNFKFTQKYFFPIHGAFKALSRDFDKDGDLDIAAISYFPDKDQPLESFVFLQQTGALHFIPYSIKEATNGRWITMDAADVDGDSDDDIVIGSLYLPNEAEKKKESLQGKPLFLLLRNKTVSSK